MLINKIDIADHRELSRTTQDKRINPYIEDAEFIDLKPLLGEVFYNYVIANPTEVNVVKLLDGSIYQYNDETYSQPGIKKVLAIFSYARFALHGSFAQTGYGMVEKQSQDSIPVSGTSKRDIYTKDREVAIHYWNEVERFLNRNKTDFQKWKNDCTIKPRNNFRIRKITTDDIYDQQHIDAKIHPKWRRTF